MNRLHQLLKGITALLIAAAVVVGVPTGLTVYAGWPLPTRIPTLDGVQLALRSGIDPQLLINTLAVIVWVAWVQLVVALTVEVAAVLRGKAARRAPVLPAIQTTAARLVTTITLIAATLAPLRPDAVLAQPAPTVYALQADPTLPAAASQSPGHQPRTHPAVVEEDTHHQVTYLVRRFDTLWGIAETTLGDGRRWQEIRNLNLGRHTSAGDEINPTTERIPPGTSLTLPTDANHPASDEKPTSSKAHPEEEVTVEEGDNFWKIAETTLRQAWGRQPTTEETAGYWRQLVDTNQDRLLPPHDPDLIYPGQVFQLPTIPEPPAVPGPTQTTKGTAELAPDEVAVQQGDHFWKIAETTLRQAWGRQPTTEETAGYWQLLVDTNRDRLLPPHDPDLIYPGQVFQLPPIPEDPMRSNGHDDLNVEDRPGHVETDGDQPEKEPPSATSEPSTPSAPAVDEAESNQPVTPPTEATDQPSQSDQSILPSDTEVPALDTADVDQDTRPLLPIVARLAGLGLLAAGVVALIDRLRRVQFRQRRQGTMPTPPPVTAAKTEAALRAAAAPDATEFIDLALRALAHQITDGDTPPLQVVGVHLSQEVLRLLLWSPHSAPPPGWQVDDDGYSWVLPTTVDPTHLHLLADGVPAPYPALVTAGHDDHSQLLLDLEYLGAAQITGELGEVAATCYTMATELAASRIADMAEVVCVGFGHDLAHLERISVVDKLTDILPTVEQVNAAVSTQDVTPLQGRLAPGGDSWAPLIIFDPNTERPQGASQLLAAAHQGRAVCAVVGYPTGGQWRLHISEDTIHVHPLGHTFKRRNLTPTEQADIADLTLTAKDLTGTPETLSEMPVASLRTIDHTDDADTSGDTASPPSSQSTLELRTLGTLRVEGPSKRFPQPKCLELVTYLVLHRQGVEADTLMEALYPGEPPNNHRLDNLMWRARTTLGTDPGGQPYLPRVTAGLYQVSTHLGCDLDQLSDHIRVADQAEEAEKAHHLQAALELVKGPPFSGVKNGYGWAHTEGLITHTIVTVDKTAHRLAQISLQAGEPEQATWAARKGLTASWACEECYRHLMLAAVAQDDQTALDAVYNELIAVVDDDQGADATGWLDPETIELYERHRRRRRDAR